MRRHILAGALGLGVVAALTGGGLWWTVYGRGAGPRVSVLEPHGEAEAVIMDFSRPFPLDPPPPGWDHREFLTRRPMTISFATKEGVPALRLETNGTASRLFRHVKIDLQRYPVLDWRWYIEKPIDSPLDERTRKGDDHPARFFIAMRTRDGHDRAMEVIWGNKLKAGDYKYIGAFPHYVADGGNENAGRWRNEEIDLRRIYETIWKDAKPAEVVEIAIFCDSDETGTSSVSYVADVRMKRASEKSAGPAVRGSGSGSSGPAAPPPRR